MTEELERRTLWVRAGGRCTLCKRYLLEGSLTFEEVPLGERAHIVGRKDSEKSARGKHPLRVEDRDAVDNLLLACSDCHTEIDKKKVEGLLDVDLLRALKRQHEADIKTQTGLLGDSRTAVLRMAGTLRGDTMQMPRRGASEAVIRSAARFPFFIEAYDRQGVEIDLLNLDGEHPLEPIYYTAATRRIDAALTDRVLPGVHAGHIDHLSVFAIARVPLLVYLGWKLDDGIPADVYQRHRSNGDWQWPAPDADTGVTLTGPAGGTQGTDAVLITNLSGTTPPANLPEELRGAATWTLTPDGGPAEDVIAGPKVLSKFVESVRTFFTGLEATHKHVIHLHLFGALPLAAAIEFGRALKSDGLRSVVVTYDLIDGSYVKALEV